MRVVFALLIIAGVARADNQPQLKAAIYVIQHAVADALPRIESEALAAWGLDPTPLRTRGDDRDVATLRGCRRFTDAERAAVRRDTERWTSAHHFPKFERDFLI